MPSSKPCPEGQIRNEKTHRCNKIKTSAANSKSSKTKANKAAKVSKADERAIQDVAIMKQIQNDFMQVRSELAKMEKERDKYRDAYENMVRTMAKCHEDLKKERRR